MTVLVGLPLGAGLLSALLFLSVVKDVPGGLLLSYLAPLPIMMAGLGLGQMAALGAGLAGAVAIALGADLVSAIPFAVATTVPAFVVANRSLLWRTNTDGSTEWYPPGMVLAWLALASLVLVLIGSALVAGHPDGVRGWVEETIGKMVSTIPGLPAGDRDAVVALWAQVFPGMVAGSWLVMSVVNATLAQGLLVRLGRNRRPSPAYGELWLPGWLGPVLAVTVLVGVVAGGDAGYVGGNMAAVVLVPFALLGLATIHRWVRGRPNARLLLALAYGMLILILPWAALAAAGLGLVMFVSKRFRRADSGGGEEG